MAIDFETAVERGVEEGIQWALVEAPIYGAINGYAKLPEDHPWRELDLQWEDNEVLDVHGGVTYGPDEAGWVGFDTLHAWDVWPGRNERYLPSSSLILWDRGMVRVETERMARQISNAYKESADES